MLLLGELSLENISFLDRLFLWRHDIEKSVAVSKNQSVIHTKSSEIPVVLKFSYPGNVQYHKLTGSEVRMLSSELSKVLNRIDLPQ